MKYKLTFVNAINGYNKKSDNKQELIEYAKSNSHPLYKPEALWELNEKTDRWVKIGEFIQRPSK